MKVFYKTESESHSYDNNKYYVDYYYTCSSEEYNLIKEQLNLKEIKITAKPYFYSNCWGGMSFNAIGVLYYHDNLNTSISRYYIKPDTIKDLKKYKSEEVLGSYNS